MLTPFFPFGGGVEDPPPRMGPTWTCLCPGHVPSQPVGLEPRPTCGELCTCPTWVESVPGRGGGTPPSEGRSIPGEPGDLLSSSLLQLFINHGLFINGGLFISGGRDAQGPPPMLLGMESLIVGAGSGEWQGGPPDSSWPQIYDGVGRPPPSPHPAWFGDKPPPSNVDHQSCLHSARWAGCHGVGDPPPAFPHGLWRGRRDLA